MKKFLKYNLLGVLAASLTIFSCQDTLLDINENPNNPTEASIDNLLPGAQVAAAFWTSRNIEEHASIFVNHYYQLSPSQHSIDGSQINNDWDGLYDASLKELQTVIDNGTEMEQYGHVGIAKVHKAHLFAYLVDVFGDVPFREALQGETNPNPVFDNGESIYSDLIILLEEAIVDLDSAVSQGLPAVATDLVYGGNYGDWRKAANTLLLKMWLTQRLVDPAGATAAIDALIAEGDLIDSNSDNFVFQYSTGVNPNNQHPIYQQEYAGPGNKSMYMNNYFMFKMLDKEDPRLNYYVYNQGDLSDLTFELTPCNTRTDCEYWNLLSADPANTGYIGRDMGDPSGIPGDNSVRSTFGVYPVGGSYDDGAQREQVIGRGANGAGVVPWVTSSMRAFMLAEAALTLGTAGNPEELLQEAIFESLDWVYGWSANSGDPNSPSFSGTFSSADSAYVQGRLDDFDNANSENQRLNVIIEEKFFSQFGNGYESYNDFRRTSMPLDLPQAIVPLAPYPIRFPIGQTELTSNPNAPDVLVTDPVFWDR